MPQNPVQGPEEGVLARLSSTITVEDTRHGIQLWREGRNSDVCITLRPEAEDKLLELLLQRRSDRAENSNEIRVAPTSA